MFRISQRPLLAAKLMRVKGKRAQQGLSQVFRGDFCLDRFEYALCQFLL